MIRALKITAERIALVGVAVGAVVGTRLIAVVGALIGAFVRVLRGMAGCVGWQAQTPRKISHKKIRFV